MNAVNEMKALATAHFGGGRMQEALAGYDTAAEACEQLLLSVSDSADDSTRREAHSVLGVLMVNQLQCLLSSGLPIGDNVRKAVIDDVRLLLGGSYVLSASDEAQVARRRFKSKQWWLLGIDRPELCFRTMSHSAAGFTSLSSEALPRTIRRQKAIEQQAIRSELKAALFGKIFGRVAELLLLNYVERKRLREDDPLPALQMAGSAHRRAVQAECDLGLLVDAQLAVLVAEREFGMKCREETSDLLRRELLRISAKPLRGFVHHVDSHVTLVAHPRFSSHGIGIVSTGTIEAGAMLLAECPTVVAAASSSKSEAAGTSSYEDRFAAAVSEFVALERDAVSDASAASSLESLMALHHPNMNTTPDSKLSIIDVLCDVWHHNAMRLTEIDFRINEASDCDFDGSAMYLTASRLNHNCAPNALCVFSSLSTAQHSARGRLTVRLLSPLEEGDEVTISYCPTIAAKATKRSHCRFECACQLCKSGVLDEVVCPSCGQPRVWPSCEGARHQQPSEPCVDDDTIAAALNSAIQQVEATTNAVASRSHEGNSQVQLRKLLNLFTMCPLLGDMHHLRFRIGLESLAAGVVASPITDQEISDALCQLAMYLDDVCTKVMPPNWPLHTGLRMHLAFSLGRHYSGLSPENEEPCFLADPRIPPLVAASFQEHVITTGDTTIRSFLLRYEVELSAVGVTCPEHLDMLSRLVVAQQRDATSS